MKRYEVTFWSGFTMWFWAEDFGHAQEQAENAEPADSVESIRLMNDAEIEA
jgi:hypothetical protein